MELFRHVIIFTDDTFETHDIIGTEDDAREAFNAFWLQLHLENPYGKTPSRMELARMSDDDDADALAVYEMHLGGVNNG